LPRANLLEANHSCICVNHLIRRCREKCWCLCVISGFRREVGEIGTLLGCTRGADKSVARLGRKQATATKLGIYSTYSPRSSIHFLARCSNFCMPLKKKTHTHRRLSVQPGLRGSNDLLVGRKMATFQVFFKFREQVVVQRGQIRRIGFVIMTLEDQVGQFLLGCKCLVSRGIVVQEQDPLDDPKVVQTTGTVDVIDPRSGISRPASRRDSACPNLNE